MKILFITPWFPKNKDDYFGRYILDSALALTDLGHEVIILITKPWNPFRYENHDYSFTKLTLYFSYYFSFPRAYFHRVSIHCYKAKVTRCLESILHRHSIDIIHAHTELPGVVARTMSKKSNIPAVVTLHGISTESRLYRKKTRLILFDNMLREISRVIVVGQTLMSFISQMMVNLDHVRVIPNGYKVASSEFHKDKFTRNELHFISVSNLQSTKGIDINLLALANLSKAGYRRWHYKIIGEGPDRKKLEKLVYNLELGDRISFLGPCNPKEVAKQLDDSDVFILPSYLEAFGIAYLEAMSRGLLVVGVLGQGPAMFIKQDITGLLVKPRCPIDLTEKLLEIFINCEQMKILARQGREYVEQHYTWGMHANKLLKTYEECLSL